MVNALFVLLVDSLKDVINGLGTIYLVGILFSTEQSEIETEFLDIIPVSVKDKAIDLGDLHNLFVCSTVCKCLKYLALGCPMGVEALLRENDPSSLTVIEILFLIKNLYLTKN